MEERAGHFTVVVFLMSFDCKCSKTFLRGAMGWSTVSDCDIS